MIDTLFARFSCLLLRAVTFSFQLTPSSFLLTNTNLLGRPIYSSIHEERHFPDLPQVVDLFKRKSLEGI